MFDKTILLHQTNFKKLNNMKAKVLTLWMLLLVGGSLNVFGMEVYNVDVVEKVDIPIDKDKENSWGKDERPRTQDIFLVTCQYEDETVYLNFLANIGWVELTVTNLSTGDTWNTTQLSTLGSLSLQTSTDSGNYKVEIKTELDGNYIGYFIK